MSDTPPPAPPPAAEVWRPRPRSLLATSLLALLLVAAGVAILHVWGIGPFAGAAEQTDNALVRGRTTTIASQVSGNVARVFVTDYQQVKAGQLLATIDDSIYRAQVEKARADLEVQRAELANSDQARAARSAGVTAGQARIVDARAQLARAQADMVRANGLVRDGAISVRERDQTVAALAAAQGALRQALAGSDIAQQDLQTVAVGKRGLAARVAAAEAAVRLAEIDLAHTVIRAPEAGQLGEIHVRLGQFVTNGTELVQLVPPDRWIVAQYKEAQTARMAVGQRVRFTVDALGGQRLSGRIARIAPATGWEFAVLKPDNATGNFVKIPQRIGVLITIDPGQPLAPRLRPGMSVETHIDPGAS